jgi:DNA-binding MarR family transcriptional regulator
MRFSNSVSFEVQLLSHVLLRSLERGAPDDAKTITVLHGQIIAYLSDCADKEIYQRDVEEVFAISRSTVAKVLKLMEAKGLITREEVPKDARLKRLRLTQTAIQMHENFINDWRGADERFARGISQDELNLFFEITAKIRKNAEL